MASKTAPGPRKLSMHIEGRRIAHDKFLRAVESFFGILKDVTAELAGSQTAVNWIVSVKSGSINLEAMATPASPGVPVEAIAQAAYEGMRDLQKKGDRPRHFTDEALSKVKLLARQIDGYSVEAIQIRQSRSRLNIRQEAMVTHVDEILGGVVTEVGTVEGRLDMMSARGRLYVAVWDALDDRRIPCYLNSEKLLEDAKNSFGRRAEVFGTIRLDALGDPMSIDVEKIVTFPKDDTLPDAEDVYGILSSK